MGKPKYLIDTNTVIDYLGNKVPASGMDFMHTVIDAGPHVSVITKIELPGFNAPECHYKTLTDFISDATVLELTNSVAEASIEIRKKHKTKLPDAIIAATALVNHLDLISHNIADFKNIDGIKVIDPYKK